MRFVWVAQHNLNECFDNDVARIKQTRLIRFVSFWAAHWVGYHY